MDRWKIGVKIGVRVKGQSKTGFTLSLYSDPRAKELQRQWGKNGDIWHQDVPTAEGRKRSKTAFCVASAIRPWMDDIADQL